MLVMTLLFFGLCANKGHSIRINSDQWINNTTEHIKARCPDYNTKMSGFDKEFVGLDGHLYHSFDGYLAALLQERKALLDTLSEELESDEQASIFLVEHFQNGKYKAKIWTDNRKLIFFSQSLRNKSGQPIIIIKRQGKEDEFDWLQPDAVAANPTTGCFFFEAGYLFKGLLVVSTLKNELFHTEIVRFY